MLHKHILMLAVFIAIVTTLSTGCQQGNLAKTANLTQTNMTAISTEQVSEGNSSDFSPVTKEEFINAVKTLKTPYEIQNELTWDTSGFDNFVNRIFINDGEKIEYEADWLGYQGTRSAFVIFKKDGTKNIPIYFCVQGRDVISVKQINVQFENKKLIEIVYYIDRGTSSAQAVDILAIEGDMVKNVWEFDEIGNDTQFDPNTRVGIKHTFTATI